VQKEHYTLRCKALEKRQLIAFMKDGVMPAESQQELLRGLPQIDELLSLPTVKDLLQTLPHALVAAFARKAVDAARQDILSGTISAINLNNIAASIAAQALALTTPSLHRVINATGVIIHTNLGRSALANTALQAVNEAARGYSTLEYSLQDKFRGSRHQHYEQLICTLTGAEAALAVNNNAAAVMMVLTVFAGGHEAIVSRGEQVEIGGSFRIPDIMRCSNAKMIEVGTTNKTHISDYASALTDDTTLLLKVHPSNFRIFGFTQTVSVKELRELANSENKRRKSLAARELLIYEDQGAGILFKLEGITDSEPTVPELLQQGCDLVSFSADKLLGGPQCGIIVGAKRHIDCLKASPLARVLRLDKMTLAALEATLRLYLDTDTALQQIPTLRMLTASLTDIEARAQTLRDIILSMIPAECVKLAVLPETCFVGGGTLPMTEIATFVVSVEFLQGSARSCEGFLINQRSVPVISRIKKDALLFDVRTLIDDSEITEIALALKDYCALTLVR
jgi:L-seryl-tRNA(Ser) seleniumtransferase